MKRLSVLLTLILLLSGCGFGGNELDRAMHLRADLLASDCMFRAVITADYGDTLHSFAMDCQLDTAGNLTFTVAAPEGLAGITGTISESGGKLTFDDTALAFPLLADGQFSPISGPWILMRTLRSGYITGCGMEDDLLRLSIDDSYDTDALRLDIWLDEKDHPLRGEILWKGRRILTVEVDGFEFL